jgi:hypothetical protein
MLPENESCHCIYEFQMCEKELACISCKVSKKFWKSIHNKSFPNHNEENKPELPNQLKKC